MSLDLTKLIIELMEESQLESKQPNWVYVASELGKRYGIVKTKEAVRSYYRTNIKGRLQAPIEIKEEPKQRVSIELLQDGSTVSERKIAISQADMKNPTMLIKAHGFDPNEFELVNAKNNYWDSNAGEGEVITLYQSKITVKPKKSNSGLTHEDLIYYLEKVNALKPTIFKDLEPYEEIDDDNLYESDWADLHIGSLSWWAEVGESNDYKITFANVRRIAAKKIKTIKDNNVGHMKLCFLGDFFHIDTELGTTTKGTKVDTDSRPRKMIIKGTELVMEIINLFSFVKELEVIWVGGNHSRNIEFAVFNAMPFIFRDYTNIKFDVSPRDRKAFVWGENLIGLEHGELNKKNEFNWLQNEFRELWGITTYSEQHSGHIHHESVKEGGGIIKRSNPTPKPIDKYEYSEGYFSAKRVVGYLWHKTDNLIAQFYYK